MELKTAANLRDALFRLTQYDSYEYPSQRVIEIRKVIIDLDSKLEEALKDETTDA